VRSAREHLWWGGRAAQRAPGGAAGVLGETIDRQGAGSLQSPLAGQPPASMPRLGIKSLTKPARHPKEEPAGSWFGLRFGDRGTHTSRTMMFSELADLLKFTPASAAAAEYRTAIIDDNLLGKRTLATRKLTAQRLSELYGLDPSVPIFRVLRQLWDADRGGRPLLAFLVAFARDPLLRTTADSIVSVQIGRPVATADLDAALEARLGTRLNPSVRHKVARNIGSSWTQAGHLHGRTAKRRAKSVASPSAACMALLLGYASGLRGRALLTSSWVRVLDVSYSDLSQLIHAANRVGLLNFREVGDVIEIQFPTLLRPYEEALCHG
jgi:hypothetical protein